MDEVLEFLEDYKRLLDFENLEDIVDQISCTDYEYKEKLEKLINELKK